MAPQTIAELTVYQAFMFYGALTPEDGVVQMSPEEYQNTFGGKMSKEQLRSLLGIKA